MARGAGAVFDPSGRYRYRLTRRWAGRGAVVAFVMLNPSTADGERDDPTIRRCAGFARRWGFAAMTVVNVFALRATDPARLRRARDPVGPGNDGHIAGAAADADLVVLAWGNHGALRGRDREVVALLAGARPVCLGVTRGGQPRHPLYLPRSARRRPY
ncbi:MAG TPA: DUF1643 domain-containing protein [Kofleriaceae bacterium]|nr:DUF1643 domain-containing protein [Kofleriaceae bacterium]